MKHNTLLPLSIVLLTGCKKKIIPPVPDLNETFTLTKVKARAGFRPRDSAGELLFRDSLWLFGGFIPERSNEVWNSADGINWYQKPNAVWSPRNLMSVIEFNGKIWLMGGMRQELVR